MSTWLLLCDRPVSAWGGAEPGESVMVEFDDQNVATAANTDGHRSCVLLSCCTMRVPRLQTGTEV